MTEALKNIQQPDQAEQVRARPRRRLSDSEDSSKIVWIATDKIRPNRAQPRRYGILQPLTVRVIENAPDGRCF